jgi:CAAX prenyl protease-like protein
MMPLSRIRSLPGREAAALIRFTNAAYVTPFGVYIVLMAIQSWWPMPDAIDLMVRLFVVGGLTAVISRPVLDFRIRRWAPTFAVGVGIFIIWVVPDLLFPGYRHSVIFENLITRNAAGSLSEPARFSTSVLALRILRTAVLVPVVEELFWRAWLMRWLIDSDVTKVALGAYSAASFWMVAVLFAAEHGPYWDVGLIAGVIFNAWMIRTRSLGDLIFSHAVANGCLCAYVLATAKWEYW